ncbi:hypothetical protein WZ81_09070, partial [Leuconostoc mesenteroides subsp. cremoris]
LSFHNIKKLLYLIISDYALEIKQSGFSVYEHDVRGCFFIVFTLPIANAINIFLKFIISPPEKNFL